MVHFHDTIKPGYFADCFEKSLNCKITFHLHTIVIDIAYYCFVSEVILFFCGMMKKPVTLELLNTHVEDCSSILYTCICDYILNFDVVPCSWLWYMPVPFQNVLHSSRCMCRYINMCMCSLYVSFSSNCYCEVQVLLVREKPYSSSACAPYVSTGR